MPRSGNKHWLIWPTYLYTLSCPTDTYMVVVWGNDANPVVHWHDFLSVYWRQRVNYCLYERLTWVYLLTYLLTHLVTCWLLGNVQTLSLMCRVLWFEQKYQLNSVSTEAWSSLLCRSGWLSQVRRTCFPRGSMTLCTFDDKSIRPYLCKKILYPAKIRKVNEIRSCTNMHAK